MSRDQALVERVGADDGRKERPALTCEQFQKVALQDAVGERLPAEMIEINDGGIRRDLVHGNVERSAKPWRLGLKIDQNLSEKASERHRIVSAGAAILLVNKALTTI
jgi:hypothetical protein